MKPKVPSPARFALGNASAGAHVHRFAHEAMATVFEIHAAYEDPRYARQAAQAAFDLVDQLEQELSRFIENSDISRINALAAGQSAGVSPTTIDCLVIARQVYQETDGVFDISMGSGLESLEFQAGDFVVRTMREGVRLDLGGIGKGYALDRMAELLREWGLVRALVHGGFSSVLALEPPPDREGWPLTLSVPGAGEKKVLARIAAWRRALSGSGIQKHDHIVDPRSRLPVHRRLAAWVSIDCGNGESTGTPLIPGIPGADNSPAAVADALSTAFMILSAREIEERCRRWPAMEAWLVTKKSDRGAEKTEFLHYPLEGRKRGLQDR